MLQIDFDKMTSVICLYLRCLVIPCVSFVVLFSSMTSAGVQPTQEDGKTDSCSLQGSQLECSKAPAGPKLALKLLVPTELALDRSLAIKLNKVKRTIPASLPNDPMVSVAGKVKVLESGSASVSARWVDSKGSRLGSLLLGAFAFIMLLLTTLSVFFLYMFCSGSVVVLGAKDSLVRAQVGKSCRCAPIDCPSAAKLESSDSEDSCAGRGLDRFIAGSPFIMPSFDVDTCDSGVDDAEKPCFPERVLNELEVEAAKEAIAVNPSLPRWPWSFGLASVQGHVRSENQDYGACFAIRNYQVVIVADGLGGLPFGRLASCQAVKAAALQVFRLFSYCDIGEEYLESVCMMVLRAAERRLKALGQPLELQDQALRTTLIVVIGGQHGVGYAYIGDGGISVYRGASEIVHLLRPQKADIHRPNLLTASLGPTPHGEPVSGKAERHQSDLIFVGTDGFFDRLEDNPEAFPVDTNKYITRIVKGAVALDGNLQTVAEQVLNELSNWADESGFIFDDNLTLALMGDGSRPHTPTDEESSAPEPVPDSPALDDVAVAEKEREI